MPATATPAQVRARVALAAAVALSALWIGAAFVPAILWAAAVSIAVEPMRLRLLRRRPGSDTLVAGLITLAVILIVVVPLVIAVTRAIAEVDGITAWINSARAHGVPVAAWVANLPVGSAQLTAWWTNHLATPEGAAEQIAHFDMGTIQAENRALGSASMLGELTGQLPLVTINGSSQQFPETTRVSDNFRLIKTGYRAEPQGFGHNI